jgi:drug/metabolite transporter (DMT)-like permease
MTNLKGAIDWYKQADRQTSESLYRRGRVRTVWIGGVLIFGGVLFIVTTVSDFILRPYELKGIWEVGWLAISLLLWGLAGYILGVFQWRRAVRQHANRRRKQRNHY